ncbi:MAG: phosphate/phosphite/phosphonate ABC transporter substrate-binding protein [Halioglobus sp.]|nr:phosphate/phosphite/phosphonate ABC transporter substrate-binding protein [Halioglobus sp.]
MTATGRAQTNVRTYLLLLALVIVATGWAVSYYQSVTQPPQTTLLRIGVLPDRDPSALRRKFEPLLDHLAAHTGIRTTLLIPDDYADIVRMFSAREIDLAYMGGLTFVQAQAETGAQALVMRELDTRFTTWFIARPELSVTQRSSVQGKRLLFGNKLSTSGHLMPRHFLQRQWDIEPETFFSAVGYSGAHDETVAMVLDGRYDIGAVSAAFVQRMVDEGSLGRDELQVLWRTPPYPNYVWAVQPDLDGKLKTSLRNAFLQLDPDKAHDQDILASLGAQVLLPAGQNDFAMLGEIAAGSGALPGSGQ